MSGAERKKRKLVHTPFERKPKEGTPLEMRQKFRNQSAAKQIHDLQDRAYPEDEQKKILLRMAIKKGIGRR